MVGDLYDFHSHILPGMDDGYQDEKDAIEALKISYDQGVRYMVATPHYLPEEPVDSFLRRREEAAARLAEAMQHYGGSFPELCLGAEVTYYPGISQLKTLRQLCIGRSRYLLLELPFREWGVEVYRDVQNICNAGRIVPILAHFERYIPLQSDKTLSQMLSLELLLQMDTEFIGDKNTRRFAKKMLKESPAFLLGTDCHNLTDRRPDMGQIVEILQKSRMEAKALEATELSKMIWAEAIG